MILTQAQAEAVYSAMCALNNVGGIFTRADFDGAQVFEAKRGTVVVQSTKRDSLHESYPGQAAFATAYGLSEACPECGGRGEVETGIGMMICTSRPN